MTRLAVLPLSLTAVLVAPSSASALCAGLTERQQFAAARVVFVGMALPGPSARGELLSPARFRVSRYFKGTGPRRQRVETATSRIRGAYRAVEDFIDPKAGERWLIFGTSRRGSVLQTSICSGSRRLRRGERAPFLG